MAYVIGIDSGGTKTEAIAYDLAGQELARVVTGFGNLLVDYETGLANIKEALSGVLEQFNEACQLVVLGLAGIDSSGLKDVLAAELATYQLPLVIINDGKLAHLALLRGEDGILVISGTGSVAIGRQGTEWYRVGGWGHLLGDEGSAYEIAKQAMQTVLRESDNNLPTSKLSEAVLAYLQVEDVMALVQRVYQLNKGQVAELAAVVAEIALKEDNAKLILAAAGEALAKSVVQLVHKMQLSDPVTIALNGSVIEKNKQVRAAFFASLKEQKIDAVINQEELSSAKGAYYLFKKGWQAI